MKRIINIISITLGIFIFTACQDELNNELFHKFSYLVENGWQTCEVEIKDGNIAELLIDFGINGTSENDKDITLKITNDPDTLADYNFDKFKNQINSYYIELPTNCYSFDQEVYTIPKGKYKTTAKIQIELDKIQNIYNDYVLPLKIESSTGESVGPSKYSKLLAYILPTNRFSEHSQGLVRLQLTEQVRVLLLAVPNYMPHQLIRAICMPVIPIRTQTLIIKIMLLILALMKKNI